MSLCKHLQLWAKTLLEWGNSIYARTGPGREAHARATMYENLAKQHTHLSAHLHAIDRLLRRGHEAMLVFAHLPDPLPNGRKGRQHQCAQPVQMMQQRQSSSGSSVSHSIEALADNIANLRRERQEIQKRLDSIARQMKLISK